MENNNTRSVALAAIYSVVLEKKSLSAFPYPTDVSSLTKSLVFGTLRFYHQLNDIVTERLNHSLEKEDLDIHCLMLLGAYQILHSNIAEHASIFETVNVAEVIGQPWAKPLVNAILRQVQRDKEKLLAQTHYSHPTWLLKKIKQYYPNDFEQIFTQNNTQAPMTLRLHPAHDIDAQLDATKISVAPQARVLNQAMDVYDIADFEQGSCFVQDASAQLAAQLLAPTNNDKILDACCAPGGKTTHISELAPNAKITALDSDNDRLKRVQENIDRFNIKNISLAQGNAQTQDWWNGQLFDKILLDAPCSATGVIRRHPDIKLLRKPKDISALVTLQKDILNNLWVMLKPGGTLLYATCSILKPENEQQIATFLSAHPDAIEEKINIDWGVETTHGRQQLPCREFDGFYYAKLKKL
ncbi:16S rRNA (cytosine(967)-C(5))-methyltransferase RsmB [Bathymodiolus septemdierum thioautotrophic gill symbiont]|uniref:16S rRNA (cytosine(967)-C(5))-methyltransferase n=1 Tax=endosymbiont of Bathymodiolus septemdierum str. Myojin knoll TaxID=1303921 RepID=A0A0P0UQK0_9GAMM|nr:16S rRNA (cytosine(967)-C(5))-methyltransferase RsmB [Bathymodiolus septemdierum thioautotrophic gill symbiont]BAS67341.1 16S rRNA (cytosine967-C5)-methyltransferase [endosymbiont of Bathymodiolus septemdierum str. Myojin knoll]